MTDNQGVEPNRFAPEPIVSDIGAIPDREYAPFSFDDEHDTLIFQFSREEFAKVLSALRNGSYMTYGDDGSAVYWSFLRNVDYPIMLCASIIDCLTTDTDTQEALANLIASNPAVQAALSQFIKDHPDGSEAAKNLPIPTTTGITPPNEDCDLDILWAQCRGIVTTANTFIGDFLEQWELFTNQGEVVKDVLGAIPLLSELASASGVSGVIEYANDLSDSIGENYNGDYDEAYEIQLACDLFCLAQTKPDCVLTIDDIFHLLQDRLTVEFTPANITELIVSLADFDITGINVADLYMFFFFAALELGNIIIPVTFGFDLFVNLIAVINEPNDDWSTLCEDCPEVGVPNFSVTDGFPPRSLGWFGGGTRTPIFVDNPATGQDTWDIPFARTQDDNYQCLVDISPDCKVYSVEMLNGTTGINFYAPTPSWTDSDDTNILACVKAVSGTGHEDTARVVIGPAI